MAKTEDQILTNLVKLGFSPLEARAYLVLLKEGALTASEIAQKINILPNAVYRLTKNLGKKGFVVGLGGHPQKFQARPPEAALTIFKEEKETEIERAKTEILKALTPAKKAPPTRVVLVSGQGEVFSAAVEMYKRAKREILLISIGEPIPEELLLAIRDALGRGVKMKMIAHKYDEENKNLLLAWSRMGMEIRHYPDWGFHLLICDGRESLLAVNNPQDTRERTGMIIVNKALAKALREYFFGVWKKAQKV